MSFLNMSKTVYNNYYYEYDCSSENYIHNSYNNLIKISSVVIAYVIPHLCH